MQSDEDVSNPETVCHRRTLFSPPHFTVFLFGVLFSEKHSAEPRPCNHADRNIAGARSWRNSIPQILPRVPFSSKVSRFLITCTVIAHLFDGIVGNLFGYSSISAILMYRSCLIPDRAMTAATPCVTAPKLYMNTTQPLQFCGCNTTNCNQYSIDASSGSMSQKAIELVADVVIEESTVSSSLSAGNSGSGSQTSAGLRMKTGRTSHVYYIYGAFCLLVVMLLQYSSLLSPAWTGINVRFLLTYTAYTLGCCLYYKI